MRVFATAFLFAATVLAGCAAQPAPQAPSELGAEVVAAQEPAMPKKAHRTAPQRREDWFYGQRAFPLERIPTGARARALAQAEAMAVVENGVVAGSAWELIGPVGFNSDVEPTWGTMSGRARALAIDPANPQRLFYGSASGGVWRSTDGGTTWTPLTDDQGSLAIGAVGIAPMDSNTVYAGTGEGNGDFFSVGILKSTDGGATWAAVGANIFDRGQIAGLNVQGNGATLVACAKDGLNKADLAPFNSGVGGLYRSTDGGANFTLRGPAGCECRELETTAGGLYASISQCAAGGIYKSVDGGDTWALLGGGAPAGAGVGRLAIGASPDGMTVFAGGIIDLNNDTIGIFKSVDGGTNWAQLNPTTVPAPAAGDPSAAVYCLNDPATAANQNQCSYDNVVEVNPNNANDVFLGGIALFRSTDGGTTFNVVGANNNGGGPLHVDHHLIEFGPGNTIYNGNDGGLYKSTDNGATWTALGGTVSTIQAYHVSVHPTDAGIVLTGNQDNGTTRRTNSNTWTEEVGGDGGYSAIDPQNPMNMYASTSGFGGGGPVKSTDGGATFPTQLTLPAPGNAGAAFIPPLAIDPTNGQILYAGTMRVFRSADGGATWPQQSADLDGSSIVTIAVSPSNAATIWATTSGGGVFRSTDSAANFNNVFAAPLPMRFPTWVAAHPTDPNTAFVAFSGFNSATPGSPGHVFRTTDGGATWVDVTGNLPDVPTNVVLLRPNMPDEVYVGTDVGVFLSTNTNLGATATWARMTGLPNAPVLALAANAATNRLYAATYGRSTWRVALDAGPACMADTFEPDANAGQAKAVASGTPKAHSICPVGDDDWSSFTLTAESSVVLETTGGSTTDNTRMVLRDVMGNQIELDDDSGTNFYSRIDRLCGTDALPAGMYFVEVDELGDDAEIADYTLNLTATACATSCPATLTLANQTLSGMQTQQATQSVTLGPALTVDGTGVVVNAPTVTFVSDVTVSGTFQVGNTTTCP